MPSVGPSLPPHLAKRNRDEKDDRSSSPESSEKRRRVAGPAPPPRVSGPARPPPSTSRSPSVDNSRDSARTLVSKPTRVHGPAAPPAPLSERPPNPSSDDSDSSDDDFGPAPPPVAGQNLLYDEAEENQPAQSAFDTEAKYVEETKKVKRDDWMTMPPTQDDLAARMDPSKIRARKFNTGKGARGGASGGDGMGVWTETPEQKLKRLQNEALGVSSPANASDPGKKTSRRSKDEEEKARRIKERVEAARGKSLVEQHGEKGDGKEKEDDPSKRGFDWEKDMGSSSQVTHKQRNELLKKAKGFGDRFSSGSYL